jgi:cysteine desulfurase
MPHRGKVWCSGPRFCISGCNSKETELSHVIEAIRIPENYASGTIRITLGMDNTEDQMYTIADQIQRIIGM